MSLARRIIPTILSKNGLLVKGKGFAADRVVGNALQSAKIHAMRGVDELMILDVTATKEGREPDYEFVKKLTDNCFTPVTVGGGIKSSEHVRKLLRSGADKVCIGTETGAIEHLSAQYGSSTIVVSIAHPDTLTSNQADIQYSRWKAMNYEQQGAGEILLQNVKRDGTMQGYDLDLIESVASSVNIPVIASGGCKDYEDMYNAIQSGANAVAVGALFQFTDATPQEAAEYLHNKGVEVRL